MASIRVVGAFGPFVLRHHALTLCFCVGALCAPALGDKILAKGNYAVQVDKITGFQKGAVIYLTPSGREMDKPLRDILQITIDGQDAFNQAEQLRRKDKAADAAELYDTVISGEAPPWVIEIARSRKADLMEQPGQAASKPEKPSARKQPPQTELDRLREENRLLKARIEAAESKKAEGQTKPGTPETRPTATPDPNAIWRVISAFVGALDEANKGTALQKETQTRRAIDAAKANLASTTFVLSYPIRDVAKQNHVFVVTLDPPLGVDKVAGGISYYSQTALHISESEALAIKSGDILSIRCRMRLLEHRDNAAPKDVFLLVLNEYRENECRFVTGEYRYSVAPAKNTVPSVVGASIDEGSNPIPDTTTTRPESKPSSVVTCEQVLPLLLAGLAKAKNAGTTLGNNEQMKAVAADVNAMLSKGTLEISYPIRDIVKLPKGYRVDLAAPSGWPKGYGGQPTKDGNYFQYRSQLEIFLPEADALKVKPGWLLTVRARCKVDCVAYGGGDSENGVLNLIDVSTEGGDGFTARFKIRTSEATYAVHPGKVENK
ncbi:MAG: hypothetical protein NTV86_04280 [Planctomycetota bacterium]|nr:hypothetical protein [Planctomycetota bacterium]